MVKVNKNYNCFASLQKKDFALIRKHIHKIKKKRVTEVTLSLNWKHFENYQKSML